MVVEETDRPDDVESSLEKTALLNQGLGPAYGEVAAIDSKSAGTEREESDDLCPSDAKYYPFLDITRICCVAFVAVDHGNPDYGYWNSLASQNWVLQYLFLVCGVCYGMSKRGLLNYESRLFWYAVLGICINWSAWLMMGMDWKSNFFNVIFHIWFIIGLMAYAVVLLPIRNYMAKVRDQSDSQGYIMGPDADRLPPREEDSTEQTITVPRRAQDRDSLLWALAVVGGGFLGLLVLFHVVLGPLLDLIAPLVLKFFQLFGTGVAFWGLPENSKETYAYLQRLCQYINVSCTNMYLIVACTRMFKRRQITPWIVIFNTYINRLLFYRAADERPFHGLDLMTIALAVYYLGLLHRRKLGEYMVRYWFCVVSFCALLWPLGAYGRFDEDPPVDVTMRIRYNALEAVCVIGFFLIADRVFDPKIFTEDKLDWMNDWALLVFLVHKAVHIMLPQPWNWFVIVALVPTCYFRRRYV